MSQPSAFPRSLVTLFGVLTLLHGLVVLAFFLYAIVWFNHFMDWFGVAAGLSDRVVALSLAHANGIRVVLGGFASIGLLGMVGGTRIVRRTGRWVAIFYALLNLLACCCALDVGLREKDPLSDMGLIVTFPFLALGASPILVLPFARRHFVGATGCETVPPTGTAPPYST